MIASNRFPKHSKGTPTSQVTPTSKVANEKFSEHKKFRKDNLSIVTKVTRIHKPITQITKPKDVPASHATKPQQTKQDEQQEEVQEDEQEEQQKEEQSENQELSTCSDQSANKKIKPHNEPPENLQQKQSTSHKNKYLAGFSTEHIRDKKQERSRERRLEITEILYQHEKAAEIRVVQSEKVEYNRKHVLVHKLQQTSTSDKTDINKKYQERTADRKYGGNTMNPDNHHVALLEFAMKNDPVDNPHKPKSNPYQFNVGDVIHIKMENGFSLFDRDYCR